MEKPGADLALIIPTYNERDNVEALYNVLQSTLKNISWEVIFVDDDSNDGTKDALIKLASQNLNVRFLERIGRRGLASACIEGMCSTAAPVLAVMDADMQHDHTLLPKMLSQLKDKNADLVVGSRYTSGGGTGKWGAARKLISKIATWVSSLVIKTRSTDPMSGFFMLRRSYFERIVHRLTGIGFKILLDILASSPKDARIIEVPYTFQPRHAGESKLDTLVAWEYFVLIAEKLFKPWIPFRFILFTVVGFVGAFIHLIVLGFLLKILGLDFNTSQIIATFVAMTSNFVLNNIFSYRDQRLHGLKFIRGLFTFYLACSLGALINYEVAIRLFHSGLSWWVAGFLGAIVGSIWNYAVTSIFTWGQVR